MAQNDVFPSLSEASRLYMQTVDKYVLSAIELYDTMSPGERLGFKGYLRARTSISISEELDAPNQKQFAICTTGETENGGCCQHSK